VIASVKAGAIRALAVTGAQRSPFLPEVPTMKEQGYNVVVESLAGVFLPAKTPAKIVEALSTAMREAARSKPMIDSLAKFGTEPTYMPPAEFATWIKERLAQWGPVVKASGFVATE
jgi:tripartite-type tricarboxylate transporter receptor subunit TctC